MNAKKLVFLSCIVVVAFGIGLHVGTRGRMDSAAYREQNPRADSEHDTAALREENRRLKKEIAQLRAAARETSAASPARANAGEGGNGSLGEWRALANLKKAKMADNRIVFMNPAGKLHDAFATLFELSATELDTLQQATNRANDRLAELERQNATVSHDEKGIVTIQVKPFAAAGGVIYDELLKAFAETLGPERYQAFLALGAEQMERTLANFGAQERSVRFSYDPSREKAPYIIRDDFTAGSNRSAGTSVFQTREDMDTRVGTITRLLPPDFGGR